MPRSETRRDGECVLSIAVFAALLLASPACRPQGAVPSEASPAAPAEPTQKPVPAGPEYSAPYEFNEDWFSHDIPLWRSVLEPLKGRPNLRYLEVGIYEGRSFFWVLDNILTDPSSRATGIDIKLWPLLEPNVERSGRADRIDVIIGDSNLELRKLPIGSFDLIYIDGSHAAQNVLTDAVLSWQLLKEGGILIFDDYAWDAAPMIGRPNVAPPQLLPGIAIDGFIAANAYEIEILRRGYQMVLKKTPNLCAEAGLQGHCSPFGPYLYDWKTGQLLLAEDPTREVDISKDEAALVEVALGRDADERARRRAEVEALMERLRVDR
jgi:SAM-dependent methyltransferase